MRTGTVVRVVVVAVIMLALGVGAYISVTRYFDPAEEAAQERERTAEQTAEKTEGTAEETEQAAGETEQKAEEGTEEAGPEGAAAEAEESLALYYGYLNTGAWEQAYGLLASESKEQVSLEKYTAVYRQVGDLNIDISVSSAEVRGDKATLDVKRDFEVQGIAREDRQKQQMVREDGVWRVLLSDEQLEQFGQSAQEQ